MSWVRRVLLGVAGVWLGLEVGVRLWIEWPLATGFYGSLSRAAVRGRQATVGVRVASGPGWAHLGWIADPEAERYRIERRVGDGWAAIGRARYGSRLLRAAGAYRVVAEPLGGGAERVIGAAGVDMPGGEAPVFVPRRAGPWQPLFRPRQAGEYVNDHCLYRDAGGAWRLAGITGPGRGDYRAERRFAAGESADFPPADGMRETTPIADFGELAWAPHALPAGGRWHLFWSPHRLHHMVSDDGRTWRGHRVVIDPPMHRFFRDAMVLPVADGQWLLYATARGAYRSRVDVYQSFDLEAWQYIGGALRSGWGAERNAIVGSMESPFVVPYRGRWYLLVTYNNDSFVWPALLLPLRVWSDRASYNDTLVLQSDNPYDFGTYRGAGRTPALVARLGAHAAEVVHVPERDAWYLTTAGWPWAASLTSGEVAVAPLAWDADDGQRASSDHGDEHPAADRIAAAPGIACGGHLRPWTVSARP